MKIPSAVALVGLAIDFAVPTFAQDTVDPKVAQQIRVLATKFDEATRYMRWEDGVIIFKSRVAVLNKTAVLIHGFWSGKAILGRSAGITSLVTEITCQLSKGLDGMLVGHADFLPESIDDRRIKICGENDGGSAALQLHKSLACFSRTTSFAFLSLLIPRKTG